MPADKEARGRCILCDGLGSFIQVYAWNGVEEVEVDAFWAHDKHPEDGHDFRII